MMLSRTRLALLAGLTVLSLGCPSDNGGVGGVLVVANVEVTPGTTSVVLGQTTPPLVAVAKTESGIVVPGRTVSWSSLNSAVATVSSNGAVTGHALGGPVTIRATVDGVHGDALVTVNAVPVDHVTVSPPTNPLAAGASVQLTASAFDASNTPLTGRSFLWTSSNDQIAAVTTTGMVLALVPGGPVTITATSEGKSGTATVTVTSRPADRLGFAQQPTTTSAGSPFNPTIKVAIQDNLLATVTGATNPVTIALAANPGGSTLSGTTTVNAVNGVATFGNLTLNKVGTAYTLLATSGTLTAVISSPFDIVAAGAGGLAFKTAPPTSAQSGAPLAPQPVVQVVDQSGNDVHQGGLVVTATIASGAGALAGTVAATTNSSGTATFASLSLSGPVGSYALAFSAPGVTGLTSAPIALAAGAPSQLAIATQPSSTAQSGFPLAQQPRIQVVDGAGNPVGVSGRVVIATLASGSGALGGATSATTDATGLAVFTSLSINGVAGSYTLRFAAPNLGSVVSNQVTLGAGAPTQIVMTVQPSSTAQVGVPLAQQPSVQLRDVSNNPTSVPGVNITVSASVGGNVLGTTTVTTNASGVAAFTGLALTGPVSDYTLTFIAPGLDPATSNPITLSAGSPTQLGITTQPGATASNGVVFAPQPVIQLQDAAGNAVVMPGVVLTVAIASGPAGAVLGGTLTATTNGSGTATFTNLKITGPAGSYTLRFSATGLTSVTSGSIGIGAGAATTIVAVSPLSQTAVAGTNVPTAPSVKVTDASSSPVAGVAVIFTITAGGGSTVPVQVATVNTDAAGIASLTSWKVGTVVGINNNTLKAMAGALGPVTFTSSVTAAAASQVAAASVTTQSAPVSTAVSAPPKVKVTDAFGNPVSGFAVSFAVTSIGGGSVVPAAPATVLTDALGIAATTSWTLGSATGTNNNTVTATAAGLSGSPVTFNASGTAAGPTTIFAVSVTTQSATAGTAVTTPPSVKVTDGTNPVAGVVVTFAVAAGNGSITGSPTVTTDALGIATVGGWTLDNTAGTNTLTASVTGLTGSPVIFTATGTAGAAALINPLSATTQSATVGTAVTFVPQVQVTDIHGNAVGAGFNVVFTLGANGGTGTISPSSPATVATDASGLAALTSWTLGNTAGTNTVTASGTGISTPATFNATGTADVPTTITANSSLTVTANAGTTVASIDRPSIHVTDSHGNAVQGASVVFTLTTGGSISPASPATVSTDASGNATLTSWTLDNTAGNPNSVTASAAFTGTTITFTATGTVGPAANITATSPTSQSGTVGTTVTPPSVHVTDAHGNAVAAFSVTFTLTANGNLGSITPSSPASVATDGSGNASLTTWTLGHDVGTNNNTVVASGSGTTSATFNASATVGAAVNISAVSTLSQTGTAGSNVAIPPSVKVTDQFGNPVSGISVNFKILQDANGGLVDGASASNQTTNSSGIATVGTWTLGTDVGTDNNVLDASIPVSIHLVSPFTASGGPFAGTQASSAHSSSVTTAFLTITPLGKTIARLNFF